MLNPNETLGQKFVKKGFWLYFFTLLIGPLGYLIKIIISHDLSVGEVGMVYGVISFVTLLSTFNDLGCTESLNYFLPKYIIKGEYEKAKYILKIVMLMQFVSSSIITGILLFFANWLSIHYFSEPNTANLIQVSVVFFFAINIFHVATVFFSVSQNTKLQKGSELIRLLVTFSGSLILLLTARGTALSYMWIWALGTVIGAIIAAMIAYHKYYRTYFLQVRSEPVKKDRNTFFRYALATLFTANIGVLLSQVDMQLIILLLGKEATGYYSNYLSLLNIPFIFISPIVAFLFPVLSELHGREEIKKMQILHASFTRYLSIAGVWIAMFMFSVGVPLSIGFFGEKFAPSGNILAYSAPFLVLNLLIQINFQFLAGTGRIRDRARILLIVLPINIILNLILIRLMGVAGSALAVGLSWIPLWWLSYRATEQHRALFDWRSFMKNIFLALIAYGINLGAIAGVHHLGISGRMGALTILTLAFTTNLAIFMLGNRKLLLEAITLIRHNRH